MTCPQERTQSPYNANKGKKNVEFRWLRQLDLEGNPSTSAIRAALDQAAASGRGRCAGRAKQIFIRM